MARIGIPKKITEAVLGEYSHRCAICGSDRPHLHHIDEDPSNNDVMNLLPLCPNCHLRDQHNPTHRVDTAKLLLFRRFKDPGILRPQFHPLFTRQAFLAQVAEGDDSVEGLESQATELIEMVQALEMGQFYAKRLSELIAPVHSPFFGIIDEHFEAARQQQRVSNARAYRTKLVSNRESVQALLVELLRFQPWQ
jgi:hypothetical protein